MEPSKKTKAETASAFYAMRPVKFSTGIKTQQPMYRWHMSSSIMSMEQGAMDVTLIAQWRTSISIISH